jgi:LysM repeat protein
MPPRLKEINLIPVRHSVLWRTSFLTGLLLILLLPAAARAQQGPGAAFFSYKCGSSSISFFMYGAPVLQVSFSEILSPLSAALATNQNQPIKSAGEIALWALHSDELQLHQIKDPDLTRYVLPSTICGPLNTSPIGAGSTSAQAIAIVQLNGEGHGIAVAQVNASGQVLAFAAVSGNGVALAAAQASSVSNNGAPTVSSGAFHIVAKGENLFRIALNYGTTVAILAQINNITDPTRIFVGQKIFLP